jgi:hypothetical protein
MGEQNYPFGIDWSTYNQVKLELTSAQREKTYKEINKVIEQSQERGLNNHFISGLELAANIALFGAEDLINYKKKIEDMPHDE